MWLYGLIGLLGCFIGSSLTLLAVGLAQAAGGKKEKK
nr:MAG TPA: Protein of unknown function (DUF3789) [Bacteriophage sp.]